MKNNELNFTIICICKCVDVCVCLRLSSFLEWNEYATPGHNLQKKRNIKVVCGQVFVYVVRRQRRQHIAKLYNEQVDIFYGEIGKQPAPI